METVASVYFLSLFQTHIFVVFLFFLNTKSKSLVAIFSQCALSHVIQRLGTAINFTTFQGAPVGCDDHLLRNRFSSGVVVNMLQQKHKYHLIMSP